MDTLNKTHLTSQSTLSQFDSRQQTADSSDIGLQRRHTLLVIVVTYNAMQWIDRCLDSVKEWDIFVVDNGSSDGTQQYIAKNYPDVIFRQSKSNLGFGKANNIGLQYAIEGGYDFVYLLNQDAWVYPRTIDKLIELGCQHPEYGVLSPFHIQGNTKHLDAVFGSSFCSWQANKAFVEDLYFARKLQEVYEADFVSAAHWLISRTCVETVGGFSPAFYHCGEDNNYLHRLRYKGFKVGVVPQVKAVHDREHRAPSLTKDLYITHYVDPIIWLSNINEKMSCFSKIGILLLVIKNTLKYKSLKPVAHFMRLLKKYGYIAQCAKKSKEDGAFLSTPSHS